MAATNRAGAGEVFGEACQSKPENAAKIIPASLERMKQNSEGIARLPRCTSADSMQMFAENKGIPWHLWTQSKPKKFGFSISCRGKVTITLI